MKAKDLAKASLGVGTAALLGLTSPACSSTTPQDNETPATQADAVQTTESTESTTEGAVQPQGEQAAQTEETGEQNEATGEQNEVAQEPAATNEPDCSGSKQFTEECGYGSPTRYAVLHPQRIVNS